MASGDSRLRLREIVVVEGRYDVQALREVCDAVIIAANGFRLYRDPALRSLLRRLGTERGVIVLTDADGAGLQIRNYIQSLLPPGVLRHAYIPPVPGKERRKQKAGKAGLIGVEGLSPALLRSALEPFADGAVPPRSPVSKAELFALGLSGGEGSARRRAALCRKLSLPDYLSANKLGEILGLFYTREELSALCDFEEENV